MKTIKLLPKASAILVAFSLLMATSIFASQKNLDTTVRSLLEARYPNYFEDSSNTLRITANNAGEITLKGSVSSMYDKYDIFELVSSISGVRAIHDLINVQTKELPNEIIKANIENELDLVSAILEPDSIKVAVDNGLVILDGTVSYPSEKLMAQTVASWQEGVTGIENNIKTLTPSKAVSDDHLMMLSKEVLNNRFPREDNVSLKIHDGTIELQGNVGSIWAKQHIEKELSKIIGVKDVMNHLQVG